MRRAGPRWGLPLLAAALGAAGCITVGPDYQKPALLAEPRPVEVVSAKEAAFSRASPDGPWWKLYDDAALDGFVQQALEHNRDLAVAAANLTRARAVLDEVRAARSPSATVEAGVSYNLAAAAASGLPEPLSPVGRFDAGFSVAYQLDLFGRIRRGIEASNADLEASRATYDASRITVVAETARAYADACIAGHQLEVAQRTVKLFEESLLLTERQVKAGRLGGLDVVRARAQVSQTRAALPPLQAAQKGALFRLAVLTGHPPSEAPLQVASCTTPPRLTSVLPTGDGVGFLRRRPDIRGAERRLAAATARIGVSVADLYPAVSLGVSAGLTSLTAEGFASDRALRFGLGPLIRWTAPNGAPQARIRQAEAATQAAAADFDRVVLGALRELETALTGYARELERNAELVVARDQSAEAVRLARQLLAAGASGTLDVLDAERTLATADAALAVSDGALSSQQIAIFLALGGGWETGQESPVAARDAAPPAGSAPR
ncbi:efflux transporter outer membrane subunit [Corallococcus sp. RDP092CA]|uniref:efflux transporter outer membrane subunit n=1 Tax=Corallococcus sp. RDP092CA TaxID=3109369 RepID=UPI0035AEEA74